MFGGDPVPSVPSIDLHPLEVGPTKERRRPAVFIDPVTYVRMHEQEVQRTVRQNALERSVKEAQAKREGFPISPFRVNRIRAGLNGLRQVLRPAGSGNA